MLKTLAFTAFALTAALLPGGLARAQNTAMSDLQISNPHIPQPAAKAMVAGGYVAIRNNGAQPDRLLGATSEGAKAVELHETRVDANGVASMAPVAGLDIAPGATLVLERGGHHIMFMGLTASLAAGDVLPVMLLFEKAGPFQVPFLVAPASDAGMDKHNDMTVPTE